MLPAERVFGYVPPANNWELVEGRTTNSGKSLYRCKVCGFETPAPTKSHLCGVEHN